MGNNMEGNANSGVKSKILHSNINVLDLERSVAFYKKALGLQENKRVERKGYTLSFMGAGGAGGHEVELTFLNDRKEPYDLGDNESHIAFSVEDFDAAHALHKEMECICYENLELGVYFIEDPDGYWLEIMPEKKR